MEMTFNIYYEIEEIQDPISNHNEEFEASWDILIL